MANRTMTRKAEQRIPIGMLEVWMPFCGKPKVILYFDSRKHAGKFADKLQALAARKSKRKGRK